MKNLDLLQAALTYIEDNLTGNIHTEDIARHCYCSKSTLEKLFRCINRISVRDYIIRRRMVCAARALKEEPARNLLELAVSYGYQSNEAFGRAFKSVWNCNPSEFNRIYQFSELYPRLQAPTQEGDCYMRSKKQVDISELYDLFKERKDCYFVCADIRSLAPINEISHKAGDLAILETMKRLSDSAGEEDVVFRIGGDEFVILTNTADLAEAEAVAEKVRAKNGEAFDYEGRGIPLSLHIAVTTVSVKPLRYSDLFTSLHMAINGSKV
ncbi:MAG: helix-turn-helix domain-containing protein [Eubacterium sp.]|nr:helix-turn-helix domain-containing protein [Eubacterium sp.]MCM1302880.1 helix-turn-helix domain-containing protein [Butyrivibrio sp.]MCM1343087.1 helix-turn-helix domain-containing protein [Muribaculaceae bacterium]MCM1410408.1 helix-turn-helix domain-containing protein [Lachnospiraceae bacterium]